jgi:hypothetical protein
MIRQSLTPAFASAALFTLAAVTAQAQNYAESAASSSTSTTAPYAEVQYSTLSGTTNVINLTMVPVVLANGSIAYKNLTVPLDVTENAAGVVTITAGSVTSVAVSNPPASSFKAGTYYGPGSSASILDQVFVLSGPGTTDGGATEWSVAVSPTAKQCTNPSSATFYVGSLSSNPLYSRLKAAGITSTAYSYGIIGATNCGGGWWSPGGIVGFAQTGNDITIVSFSYVGTTDHATPGAQITYTY